MTDAVNLNFLTHPFKPVYHATNLRPEKVIIREVDFSQSGDRLNFFFSKGATVDLVTAGTTFPDVVNRVCNGSFQFDLNPPTLNHPYSSPLSLQTDELVYVIYRLSRKDWQFAQYRWPITVSERVERDYFGARRADLHGHARADDGDDENNLRLGCHVAFFIVDARPRNNVRKFIDGINLHVDLIYRDFDTIRYLPIIIDPDVRYPGGSGGP